MLEILPESDDKTLIVKASGTLTAEDYEKYFIPAMEERFEHHKKINVLIWFSDDFTGWEAQAAWDDMVFGIQHRNDFEKLAVVTGQQWIQWATNIGAYFMEGQIKTFSDDQFADALNWIKERQSQKS